MSMSTRSTACVAAAAAVVVGVAVARYLRSRKPKPVRCRLLTFKLASQEQVAAEEQRWDASPSSLELLTSDKEHQLLIFERRAILGEQPTKPGAAAPSYAESFTESGLGFMGRGATPATGGWCLLVMLTFESKPHAEYYMKIFAEYADWIFLHEPSTLAWEAMVSDDDPCRWLFWGRYEDKERAYLQVHRGSERFPEFRLKLDKMQPDIDGHSYHAPRGKKIILLTKSDGRGDRAEAKIRELFAKTNYEIEVLRIEHGKPKPVEHDFRCDWLVSYVCPWVLPAKGLGQARHNINFHPGPPNYPGTGCYNFALYNGESEYGVTAHEMLPVVDSGTIYAVRRFPILPDDSVDRLQDRGNGIMFKLFEEMLALLAKGNSTLQPAEPPERWHPTKKATTTKDLDRLRVIPLDATPDEIDRRARAMAHRRYPTGGACVQLHGRRFYIPFEDAMRSKK